MFHFSHGVAIMAAAALAAFAQGCSNAVITESGANSFSLQEQASPLCGKEGRKQAMLKTAAARTLQAGYDRFKVKERADVVQVSYEQDTSYDIDNGKGKVVTVPSTQTVEGPLQRRFMDITMYKDGQAGASGALSARQVLGPDWRGQVGDRLFTCTS